MTKRPRTTSRARHRAAGLLAILLVVALAGPAAALPSPIGEGDHPRHGHSRQAHGKSRDDRVQAVLKAARSQLGTPYRYGGASPGGFDCSGFTMWSWSHGGRRLPHSSSAQYSAVRWHVKRGDLQPGDLLFFYQPIHHVAIFVGRNRMIESPHTGGRVRVVPVYWQYFTGAARPK